jgi:alkylation response protein AidB-like acyl-CoA dehydrogenase
MIGFTLTAEQLLLQKTARAFAADRVAPVAHAVRHGKADKAAVQALFHEGAALGFQKLLLPESAGGLGLSAVDACILLEELGAADVGIAGDLFALTMTVPLLILRGGNAEQHARLLPPFLSGQGVVVAGAQSEPNVGGSEIMSPSPDPARGPRTFAKRDGQDYVLNGQKSAFITNAGAAQGFVVMARTDLGKPVGESLTAFWIPRDTPGVTVGPSTALIGWKASSHAPLYLSDVRVPEHNRIGAEGQAGMLFAQLPEMPICLAACFVGLARAAYDKALDYAKSRSSHGVPIIEHQTVALRLADMAVDIQAARLMVWDAAAACADNWFEAATLKGPAAKTVAVDAAIRNAERLVQIMGGYGVTEEYGAGAMLNDAWIGWACDFTRDVLRLGMVPFLQPTSPA